MRILVTGATGFVGGRLARSLLADGHEVRALVRPGAEGDGLAALGAHVVRGDLTDPRVLDAAVAGCDLVHNLAVPVRHARPEVLELVNVGGAAHVMRAAGRAGARVVHCSTAGVYGPLARLPADEEHPARARRPYPQSKLRGEAVVRRMAAEQDTPTVIARPSSVYGPGGTRALGMFRDVLRGRVLTIGPATHLIDLAYVDDVVDGLRRAAERTDPCAPAYNLAGGAPRPMLDVLGAIAGAMGRPLRVHALPVAPFRALAAAQRASPRPVDTPLLHRLTRLPGSQAYCIERARRDLRYRPAVTLDDGIARTLRWYRERGLLPLAAQEAA